MQLPTGTSSRNVGDSVTIYGPLVYVLKFCTLRLGERIVDHTANARVSKGDKLKDWIRLTFVSIIGLLILYRSVILIINQRAAMADAILMGLNANQLVISLLSLIGFLFINIWHYDGFLNNFPREIETATRLKALKSVRKQHHNYLCRWHVAWSISLITILVLALTTEVFLFSRQSHLNDDHVLDGVLQYLSVLFFVPDVIILSMSLIALVASFALIVLLHRTLINELVYFNNEIVEAAANGQLQHADLLSNYMSRHIDILNVCGHFNQRIASLVSTWIVISAIGVICNVANFYLLLSATWPYLLLCIVLIAFWCSHFGTILYNCFSLYAQVQRTRHLVLNVKDIWQNVNEKLCLLIFGTVKRIEEFQHLQLLLIAPIEPSFFMKVTVIVLLSVVYLLATQFRLPNLRMDDGTIETNLFNLTQP